MSENTFQIAFGWAINEGYDSIPNSSGKVDHYLAYLCDSIGINDYMAYDSYRTADKLAAKIGGADSLYTVSRLKRQVEKAKNNPNVYAAQFKGMYLALKYPNENAHACDGVSNFETFGGTVYYQGGNYNGSDVKVWSLWYDTGMKHWVTSS